MNTGANGMTDNRDFERLTRKLKRLADTAGSIGAERRQVAEAPHLLAGLLTEVDETVLPRRLEFTTERGEALAFDAYGRRLLALRGSWPNAVNWTDRPLGRLSGDEMAALRPVLEDRLSGASRLFVKTSPLPERRDPAASGPAAEVLAEAWDLTLDPGIGACRTPLDALLSGLDDPARAWLRVEDRTATAWGGPRDGVARLTRMAAETLPGLRDVVRGAEADADIHGCVILGSGPQDRAVALAMDGRNSLIVQVAPGDLAGVSRVWRGLAG